MASIEVEINVLCESCGRSLGHKVEQRSDKGLVTINVEACPECIKSAVDEANDAA